MIRGLKLGYNHDPFYWRFVGQSGDEVGVDENSTSENDVPHDGCSPDDVLQAVRGSGGDVSVSGSTFKLKCVMRRRSLDTNY